MTDERVWLRHPETGGTWLCPAAAVDEWRELGWEPSEPPEEPNPVTAEHLAWREQQAAATAEQTPTNRRAARRGSENGEKTDG